MQQSGVRCEVANRIGWIRLSRPQAINSLQLAMVRAIDEKLREWKSDPKVALICISGEGERGLCAGGDMKALYECKDSSSFQAAYDFFHTEYAMDLLIHQYPKPVVAYMNGIVMGGGVGLSIGASHRIVTETTKWAMPEMNIGFFPDVGASYFLNRMPGYAGRYLALTSQVIQASDAVYCGAADFYIESKNWPDIESQLLQRAWPEDGAAAELSALLAGYRAPVPPSRLAEWQPKIDGHFAKETVEDILSSLEREAERGDPWAAETLRSLLAKPPVSLKVALRQLQLGKEKSLADCFSMELNMSMNFMKHPDFYEGVRSVLVDKDKSPAWNYPRLEDVSDDLVDSFFEWSPTL